MPPPSGSTGVVVSRWPRVDTASPTPSPTPAGAAMPAAKSAKAAVSVEAAVPAMTGPVVPVEGKAQRGEAFEVIAAAVLNQQGRPFTQVVLKLSLVPGSDAFKAFASQLKAALKTVRDGERTGERFEVSLVVPEVLTQPYKGKGSTPRRKR